MSLIESSPPPFSAIIFLHPPPSVHFHNPPAPPKTNPSFPSAIVETFVPRTKTLFSPRLNSYTTSPGISVQKNRRDRKSQIGPSPHRSPPSTTISSFESLIGSPPAPAPPASHTTAPPPPPAPAQSQSTSSPQSSHEKSAPPAAPLAL